VNRCIALLVVCAGAPPADAWAAQATPSRVTVVALAPVEVPRDLAQHGLAVTRLTALIATTLRDSGYAVVPPETTLAVWVRTRDALGGFYDTYTGKVIPTKRDSIISATRLALRDGFGADVWVRPSIRIVAARFEGGRARWDGIDDATGGTGGPLAFLLQGTVWSALLTPTSGTIAGASLHVAVDDMDGRRLYERAGGIRLLAHLVQGEWQAVTNPFGDPSRNATAVRLALDSLPVVVAPRRGR